LKKLPKQHRGAKTRSKVGRQSAKRLKKAHAYLKKNDGMWNEINRIKWKFVGRKWERHDTQSSLCVFAKYMAVRRALVDGGAFPKVRWYKKGGEWTERSGVYFGRRSLILAQSRRQACSGARHSAPV
jgi:hypothetical protein